MSRYLALLVALAIAACGGPAATSGASSPARLTPTPTSTPSHILAVLTGSFAGGPPTDNYQVLLLGVDGRVVARATARRPTSFQVNGASDFSPWQIPTVSISKSRVYFLDGDSKIGFLQPDGTTGVATEISAGPKIRLAFAVSPDDLRIAVSRLDYSGFYLDANSSTQTRVGLGMFVQDLAGGGHRVDIFSSTSVVEWPVGWHAGQLVIAVGRPYPPQNPPPNPYFASEYHVVDPQTGNRTLTLGKPKQASCVYGPLGSAGTGCIAGYASPDQRVGVQGWDGTYREFSSRAQFSDYAMALSPDGARIAGEGIGQVPGPILILTDEGVRQLENGRPVAWIDNSHLLFERFDPTALLVLDIDRGSSLSTEVSSGDFHGTLPADLG